MNKTNYENIIEVNSIEELAKLLVIKIEEIPNEYCLGGNTIVYYTHSGERYEEDFDRALQEEIRWLQRDMELT